MENINNINVLSLFDGMSCGQIALNKLGIKYDNYFASEIDERAISVTMDNYPNTIQLGSVINVDTTKLPKIDLLIGGSPCQSFSLAGTKKGMVTTENVEVTTLDKYLELKSDGFEFQGQSYLFWEYVRILKETNPKYFLLENVMMSPKWKKIITDTLGVEPILLNSSDVSIQSRKRLYWTNITVDTNIPNTNTYFYNEYSKEFPDDIILTGRGLNKLNRSRSRVYSIEDSKLPTLLKAQEKKPTDAIIIKHNDTYRYPTREEAEKMQTVPIGYTKNAKYNDAMGMLGNGWTVDIIKHIFSFIK
jgi:DNA (cytosine-5)-methyltransferase 3A